MLSSPKKSSAASRSPIALLRGAARETPFGKFSPNNRLRQLEQKKGEIWTEKTPRRVMGGRKGGTKKDENSRRSGAMDHASSVVVCGRGGASLPFILCMYYLLPSSSSLVLFPLEGWMVV